jgi:hypothetical protein
MSIFGHIGKFDDVIFRYVHFRIGNFYVINRCSDIPYILPAPIYLGLFVGPISQMQSHRWTTTVGIFLMGSGSILSAFANTPTDIFLAVGLIIGNTI